jgi:hypothetical protein
LTRQKKQGKRPRKTDPRDAALLAGTEELLALGVDLETLEPSAESVSRLAGLAPPSPEAERAIACWLGFAEIPEAAERLVAMEAAAQKKELRREIRRSLFRLEQRGVAIPRPAAPATGARALGREEDAGYLSPVDRRGDQIVWYVHPTPDGDYFLISGVLSERDGMVEADAARVDRPAFRDLVASSRARFGVRMLEADPGYCDLLLHDGYRANPTKRGPGVSRYPAFRMEITHRAPERVACPVHALLGGAGSGTAVVDESARLLAEPEMEGWLLDPVWIAPHREPIREARDSRVVVSRHQKEERIDRLMRESAAAVFAGEAAGVYARRLERMAYYFLLDGREAAARRALAVSAALVDAGSGAADRIPFVMELTRRSFAAAEAAERAREKEERRGSVIVKPGEP